MAEDEEEREVDDRQRHRPETELPAHEVREQRREDQRGKDDPREGPLHEIAEHVDEWSLLAG